MIIGIPKELKAGEGRVSVTPVWADHFIQGGHQVVLEQDAGLKAGYTDSEYESKGVEVFSSAKKIWLHADLIAKVKELQQSEYTLPRENQVILTFFHLAEDINHSMLNALRERKCTTIALEQLLVSGYRPALAPMSEMAGWNAAIQLATLLFQHPKSLKVALAPFTGLAAPRITVLGGGTVGYYSAKTLIGIGAEVTVLEKARVRISELNYLLEGRARILSATEDNLAQSLQESVGLINAAYPDPASETLITLKHIRLLPKGSVIIDVGGGGLIEGGRYTTIENPTYEIEGRIFYGVDNSPSQFANAASKILADVVGPYIRKIADANIDSVIQSDTVIKKAVNIYKGKLVNKEVAIRHKVEVEDML